MNKLHSIFALAFASNVLACSVQQRTDDPKPAAVDEAAPSSIAAPAKVPREFACNPNAVMTDTPLIVDDRLLLRPAGGACENELFFGRGKLAHKLSMVPGMIILAESATAGATRVVCFSNELHSPAPGSDPRARYTDEVHIECAAHTPSGWTSTVVAVPRIENAAAWVRGVELDARTATVHVRWMRDSKFQFLHAVERDRSPLDAVYETELTLRDDTLVVGATARLSVPLFERAHARLRSK